MTTPVDLVDSTISLAEAAKMMRDDDVGALPIGDKDRLIGILTDRDIVVRCLAAGGNPQVATARDAMSSGIVYCFDDQPVEEAADIMSERHIRRLPVLNRAKRLVGILSLGDVWARGAPAIAEVMLREIAKPVH
jgi:FOG: CBS domain